MGAASHFVAVIRAIRERIPENTPAMEVLISDLQGNWDALQLIVAARPQVINHNVETVPRLYPEVRPEADFARSVELLRRVKKQNPDILTKSGIMVGLGETEPEVLSVMATLREAGCNLLTIGQYLAPSPKHHPVIEYIHPDQFLAYKKAGEAMGFAHVASGPLVRSSYHAGEAFRKAH